MCYIFMQFNELPTGVYLKVKQLEMILQGLKTSYQRLVCSAFAGIKCMTMWVADFNPRLSVHICVQNDTGRWNTTSHTATHFIPSFILH